MNPWDHLPNAEHIGILINLSNSLTADEKICRRDYGEWIPMYNRVWDQVKASPIRDCWEDIGAAFSTWTLPGGNAALWDAIAVLIVYDDCAYMLDSDPGELAILAKLGDERAYLLLPYVTYKGLKK